MFPNQLHNQASFSLIGYAKPQYLPYAKPQYLPPIFTGGISLSGHILAPTSLGLFHRAIVQSASILSVFDVSDPQGVADRFADAL